MMAGADPDDIGWRTAAFEHVRTMLQGGTLLSRTAINTPFTFRGERATLVDPQRGVGSF
jgi:hypothetical protein